MNDINSSLLLPLETFSVATKREAKYQVAGPYYMEGLNPEMLSGALPFESFKAVIDQKSPAG